MANDRLRDAAHFFGGDVNLVGVQDLIMLSHLSLTVLAPM
jgi:hypothetical protein